MQTNDSVIASTVSKRARPLQEGTHVPFWAFLWFLKKTRRASRLKLDATLSTFAISRPRGVLV